MSISRRLHFSCLLAISGLILNSAAASPSDVWKAKPVRQWTEQETRGFLVGSPWVRQVIVGSGAGEMEGSGVNAQTGGERGESSGTQGRVDSGTIDVQRGEPAHRTIYYIEWSSAKIVRAANVHIGLLQGRIKQDPGEPPPLDAIVLTVGGPDLHAFLSATEPQLQETAYLHPRHSKVRIQPKEVKILKKENRVLAVTFTFPRVVDGQPVIPDQEKSAEFSCKAGSDTLKVSFDVNRMATEAGRDL